MKKKNIVHRFIIPLILVVGIREVSRYVYNAAGALQPGVFRDAVIGTAGPLTFFSLWFFALVGPPLAYFRGARFMERLIVAFANPVIWILMIDRQIACQYSGIERMYFFFLPWTFGIMCVTCVEFSLADIVCRTVHRLKTRDPVTVFQPVVWLMLAGGLAGMYFGLIKGQEWVYVVVHHYAQYFR